LDGEWNKSAYQDEEEEDDDNEVIENCPRPRAESKANIRKVKMLQMIIEYSAPS
jgi:hypothetical protein